MRIIVDFILTQGNSGLQSHARLRLRECLLALALISCQNCLAQDLTKTPPGMRGSADTPEAHLGAGYENLRSNRYELAAREFRAALALNPKLVLPARFPLAVSLFELHQNENARREFEAVRRAVGEHPNVEYYLGRLDLMDGKLEVAIQELTQAAAQPPFPDTDYYLGYAYLKQHNLALAEKWLLKAAELAPRDSLVQYRLGLLYAEAGRPADAERAQARAQQLRQRTAEFDQARLECTQKLDRDSLDEARPACEKLFDAGDAEKLTVLGTLYGEHGNYEAALKPLRRAAELSPNSPQTQYNLAFDFARLNRFREARGPLAKAVERWPDLFPLSALFGAVLYNLREELPAYRALHHAHELNSQDAVTGDLLYHVTLSLAKQRVSDKQYSAALEYLNEAVALHPQDPELHWLFANLYDATGRTAEAAEERLRAERLTNRKAVDPN